ncbi:hypothetical protein [Adhaeribacter radiodurans]|uniref:Uncharacterized protein n=1 Tax=Adhaeribacter radiodurans TaxID=2745197 RepID=A0A7L7LCD3_9BACT|nr:hypothetical protein [Adhaeribacter radiodurans]QMU30205.1 hypothetical protein HUW48_20185 [Adhaeribacter radiodurans]
MKRFFRLLLSCVLGLLVPAVIFPWLVKAIVPAKKEAPKVTFTPAADTTQKENKGLPAPILKSKSP